MNARQIHATIGGALALGLAIAACANPSAPPGGPPDTAPPQVLKISPANASVISKPKQVLFQFDEVVSEAPKGANGLAGLVFISPKSGDLSVSWRRTAIEVRPKKGWKPNTVYSVILAPGITDLRGNTLDSATRLVFSTGGPIPTTQITGVVFDWQGGRGTRAIMEAIAPDSTTYQTLSDSVGRYKLEHIPIGPYVLRAYLDRNNNQMLDRLEPWDTTSTTLTSTASAEFYAFAHDTLGLRIQDITVVDSGSKLRVVFDKPLFPQQTLIPPQFVLKRADSTVVPITVVLTAPQKVSLDSARAKQTADSVAREAAKKDTNTVERAKRDSAAAIARRDSLARVDRAAREAARLAALKLGRPGGSVDTTPPPKMKRPPLYTDVFLILEKPVEPDAAYRLTVNNIRSISGTAKTPNRAFRTPKPQPKDTTEAAKKDSAAIKRPPGDSTRKNF